MSLVLFSLAKHYHINYILFSKSSTFNLLCYVILYFCSILINFKRVSYDPKGNSVNGYLINNSDAYILVPKVE